MDVLQSELDCRDVLCRVDFVLIVSVRHIAYDLSVDVDCRAPPEA